MLCINHYVPQVYSGNRQHVARATLSVNSLDDHLAQLPVSRLRTTYVFQRERVQFSLLLLFFLIHVVFFFFNAHFPAFFEKPVYSVPGFLSREVGVQFMRGISFYRESTLYGVRGFA